MQTFPFEHEDFCRKHVHWLAILIQRRAFDFGDGLVWFGPGGHNVNDFAFNTQSISRPRWLRPRQFAAQSIAQWQASGDQH